VEGESTATILEIDRFRIADEKCDGIANFAGVLLVVEGKRRR
jgi:hypothetical protein